MCSDNTWTILVWVFTREMKGTEMSLQQETLSLRTNVKGRDDDVEALVAGGVVVGDTQCGWATLTFPAGWHTVPTPFSGVVNVQDERCRPRARVRRIDDRHFLYSAYKFYYIEEWQQYYGVNLDQGRAFAHVVQHNNHVLFQYPGTDREGWYDNNSVDEKQATKFARLAAEVWLDKNRPGWHLPGAYWDNPEPSR